MTAIPDVPQLERADLYQFLLALRTRVLNTATSTTAAASSTTASGGRDPPILTLDFGGVGDGVTSNDTVFNATENSDSPTIRVPDGVFATSLNKSALTKRYTGDGIILAGTDALPADFSYMATKPSTWPVQGQTGWFRGDQRFTDGGEWKIIGPGVRTYDLSQRYYESTMIPHHTWFDIESGSSGGQGYILTGAAAGATSINIHTSASQEWVGKQLEIATTFGGTAEETLTVQSVSGTQITFTTPLTKSYTWNPTHPTLPSYPHIRFSKRTWSGVHYMRVRHRGGGDGYGGIVRVEMQYQPKAPELAHTFLTGTGGQWGGETNFVSPRAQLSVPASTASTTITLNGALVAADWIGKRVVFRPSIGGPVVGIRTVQSVGTPGATTQVTLVSAPHDNHPAGTYVEVDIDGCYTTGWESAYYDQGHDEAVIAQVDSFIRMNDRAENGGRVWLGTRFQSAGSRYADAAYVAAGRWRVGLDTALGFLGDSTYLTGQAVAGTTTLNVKSTNGARLGDPVTVVDGAGVLTYSGTLTAVGTTTVSVTPALGSTFMTGSYVEFPSGGAIVSAALGQKIVWNSSGNNQGRGGDPLEVFGPLYGNVQGDIETGTATDGVGDHWYTRFNGRGHGGATSRIRLRPASFQVNVEIQGGATINSAREIITNSLTGVGGVSGAVIFGAGLGHQIRFNTSTNKFEFWVAGALAASLP